MKKKWTGERLETFVNTRDTIDHLHRYGIALEYTENKVVLDIACGEGYGSNIISKNAKFVYGVDIDKCTIDDAKVKYKKENLTFIEGSASLIPLKDNMFDIVVSFETIEHHDKHDEMLLEIKRVLKPDGILILSTPDKLHYSDLRKFDNTFHIKELYKNEFVDLINKYFNKKQLLNQKFVNGNSIVSIDNESKIIFYNGNFNDVKKINPDPLYLISIASDEFFNLQNTSIFDGTLISQEQNNLAIQNSNSFKVGSFILFPLKFLKKLLK